MTPHEKAIRDAVNARAETVEVPIPSWSPWTAERCAEALARQLAVFSVLPCVEEK